MTDTAYVNLANIHALRTYSRISRIATIIATMSACGCVCGKYRATFTQITRPGINCARILNYEPAEAHTCARTRYVYCFIIVVVRVVFLSAHYLFFLLFLVEPRTSGSVISTRRNRILELTHESLHLNTKM